MTPNTVRLILFLEQVISALIRPVQPRCRDDIHGRLQNVLQRQHIEHVVAVANTVLKYVEDDPMLPTPLALLLIKLLTPTLPLTTKLPVIVSFSSLRKNCVESMPSSKLALLAVPWNKYVPVSVERFKPGLTCCPDPQPVIELCGVKAASWLSMATVSLLMVKVTTE
jgi:hypothetical protein